MKKLAEMQRILSPLGINVVTAKSEKDCTYIGSITVKLLTDEDEQTVTGALIAEHMPRIVAINEHKMSGPPKLSHLTGRFNYLESITSGGKHL